MSPPSGSETVPIGANWWAQGLGHVIRRECRAPLAGSPGPGSLTLTEGHTAGDQVTVGPGSVAVFLSAPPL